jgi:hypothetical protein
MAKINAKGAELKIDVLFMMTVNPNRAHNAEKMIKSQTSDEMKSECLNEWKWDRSLDIQLESDNSSEQQSPQVSR